MTTLFGMIVRWDCPHCERENAWWRSFCAHCGGFWQSYYDLGSR